MYALALDTVYQNQVAFAYVSDIYAWSEISFHRQRNTEELHPKWYCSCYLWGLQLSHLIDLYVLYMFYKMCEWFIHTLQGCGMCIICQSKKTALTDVNEIFLFCVLVWVSPENKLHDAWFVHNHCIKRKSKLQSNDLFNNLIYWNLCG